MGDDAVDGPEAIENVNGSMGAPIATVGGGLVSQIPSGFVQTKASRPDGLVREVKTNKVISREEIEERLETEDVQHLGDFSDEVSLLYIYLLRNYYAKRVRKYHQHILQKVNHLALTLPCLVFIFYSAGTWYNVLRVYLFYFDVYYT